MPSNISPNHWTNLKGKLLSFLILLLFALTDTLAQSPLVQHLTTSEGLPSNGVYKIIQDSKKFIWFATDAGVARYDGSKFTYYRKQDGLSSNDVIDIHEDSFGRIWFFHFNASLNFYSDNFIHNGKNTPLLDSLKGPDYFHQLYEDENHTLYFYGNSQRLIHTLDPKNHIVRYRLPTTPFKNNIKPHTLEAMSILYMKKNANGEFIFWTPAGCYTTKQLSKRPVELDNSFRFKEVVISSPKSKYILVREENMSKFEVKKFNDEITFDKIAPIDNTGSEFISSILEDENGILWISTYDKGVYCFKEGKIVYHFEINDAKSIIQDHEKNIWISSTKEGVYKISPFFDHHEHLPRNVFESSGIFALTQHNSTSIWCTNGKSVYLLKDNTLFKLDFQKTEKSFNQILQVNDHTLLIGETRKRPFALEGIHFNQAGNNIIAEKVSQSPIVLQNFTYNIRNDSINLHNQNYVFQISTVQFFKKMRYLRIGERINNIYFNTNNELIVNAKKNYILQFSAKKEYSELSYFNNKVISDHLNLNNKTELFNIEGDSLFIYSNKQLNNLSAAFDQPINMQIKHLAYQDSTLFIATSRNIYVCKNPLNILKKEPILLNLIDINFNSIHGILFNNQRLYIASDDGLTSLPYSDLTNSTVHAPIPYFQSIQVNEQENQVIKGAISSVSGQRVNISFSSINYSVSPNIYSYRLDGSDADWTYVKGNNVVLQNLPRGNYSFLLRARKPASAWSGPIKFEIGVRATIWQHPLFYFIIIIFLTGIAFLIVLRRKNLELRRRQMEHQMILLEQKSLQSMMNPHFIFNSLGSIQNYLLHNKANEAGIYLSQFARLIRQNLNAINTSTVDLEEEVDRLRNYLDLERLRMENKFTYSIELDEAVELDDVLIPSMIIQPFVENSIWHGIANLEVNGFIGIKFRLLDEKSLQITVEDSGIGIQNTEKYVSQSDKHLHLGMTITRKRLALLSQKYGVETSVNYRERSPGSQIPGTIVDIIVPLLNGKSEIRS
ncbi:MAG: histidine kinase [Prolixibacteraceae bacterium]|nr:histidine kinase [Prolixibacteraceae bacterium]